MSTRPPAAVVTTRAALADALAPARAAGRTVALVPTMGALHRAHATLVERAAAAADVVVVSVFVNPLQFGPGEDLDRYPRSLDADVALASAAGADVVFAPSREQMYAAGEPLVRVSAGALGSRLEGAVRPGHFDGVLTVVLKLIGLVRPDVAVFGEKDAQQLALVRRMVRDLDVPVRIEAAPTVREDGGLALSSRNRYLDQAGAQAATALSRALRAGAVAATGSAGGGAPAVLAAANAVLAGEPALAVDYCTLVDEATFDDVREGGPTDALLLVAGVVEGTRLIDNMRVHLSGGGG
jgi:pantoate--beta-alanine ligase